MNGLPHLAAIERDRQSGFNGFVAALQADYTRHFGALNDNAALEFQKVERLNEDARQARRLNWRRSRRSMGAALNSFAGRRPGQTPAGQQPGTAQPSTLD